MLNLSSYSGCLHVFTGNCKYFKINNKLLKHHFYRVFGVGPLESFSSLQSSYQNILSLFWCIFIQSLIIRKFFLTDAFLADAHLKDLSDKPFLKLLFNFDGHWNYSIAYMLTLFYYIFTLPKILNNLKRFTISSSSSLSPLLSTLSLLSSSSTLSPFIIFVITLTTFKIFFVVSYSAIIFEYFHQNLFTLFEIFYSIAILYVNFLVVTLPLVLAHFIQSATLQTLTTVLEKRRQMTLTELREALKQISKQNLNLHWLNSLPMAVFVVSNTISSLSCICRFSDKPEVHFTVWFFGLLAFQFHLARLSTKTKAKFDELLRKVSKYTSKRKNILNVSQKEVAFQCQGRRVKYKNYRELRLYKNDFSLTIFNILNMNYSFVFSLVLFLLNYCVFMLQTNNV